MATKEELIEVVVEIETAAEPIRGAVRTDGVARPFDGWMQLTAALEAARAGGPGVQAGDGLRGRRGER